MLLLRLLPLALVAAVRDRSHSSQSILSSRRQELLQIHGVGTSSRKVPQLPAAWSSRFEIEKDLGEGGLGVVYKLRVLCDPSSPPVSAKFIRKDSAIPQQKQRMDAEVERLREMKHEQYVISTLGEPDSVDTTAGRWIMMPFLNSGSLLDLFARCSDEPACDCRNKEHPWLCWAESGHELPWILALVYEALEGLQALHRKGYVHLDLKPNNIMVHCEERRCMAMIIDLDTMCQVGQACGGGTQAYTAPEVEEKRLSSASDIWSMGMVLYTLLYGEVPDFVDLFWGPENSRKRKAYRPEDDEHIPKKPHQLDRLIMEMLNTNDTARISLEEVQQRLRSIIFSMTSSQEVQEMIEKSPAQRGLAVAEPSSCVSHYVASAFDPGTCHNARRTADGWYSCGFCVFCDACCACEVMRDGRIETEHFFAPSCE